MIRRLKAAFLFYRHFPYMPQYDGENVWLSEDSQTYSAFIQSPVGRKLQIRLRNFATRNAMDAVYHMDNTQWRNGKAAGIAGLLAEMDSYLPKEKQISQVAAHSDTNEQPDQHGDTEWFERIRP